MICLLRRYLLWRVGLLWYLIVLIGATRGRLSYERDPREVTSSNNDIGNAEEKKVKGAFS